MAALVISLPSTISLMINGSTSPGGRIGTKYFIWAADKELHSLQKDGAYDMMISRLDFSGYLVILYYEFRQNMILNLYLLLKKPS